MPVVANQAKRHSQYIRMDSGSSLISAGEIAQSMSRNNNEDTRTEATALDRIWMAKYTRLVAYKEKYGHCNVTLSYQDKELGSWVSNQRIFKNAGALRKDRETMLNDLGLVWEKPQIVGKQMWLRNYRRLVESKEDNGYFNINMNKPNEDKALAAWVTRQRCLQLAGKLGNDREKLLNDICFVWHTPATPRIATQEPGPSKIRPSDELRWMNKYERLAAFKEKEGHFKVPVAEDKELNMWLATQRKGYRSGTLHKDRQDLLDMIGFVWNARKNPTKGIPVASFQTSALNSVQETEEQWNRMLEKLNDYFKRNGHTNIRADGENHELLQWVSLQRRLQKHGHLEAKHEKALHEIGLSWDSSTANESIQRVASISESDEEFWMSQFRSLCDYKKKHGHTDVPCTSQQCFLNRKQPSEDKKVQLVSVITAESPTAETPGFESSLLSTAEETRGDDVLAAVISLCTPEGNYATEKETNGDTLSEVGSSQAVKQEFAIGTRIKKLFEDEGVINAFGGKVVSFDLIQEEDGTRAWGYMIHYDDGDREHMLEADVGKHVVVLQGEKWKKRSERSQSQQQDQTKRARP